MRAAGMPVPDGVVLTPAFLTRFGAVPAATRHHELGWIWRRLGNAKLAVRSSGAGEDGANHSFAGVFESVIDVDRDGLEAAIAQVQASFEAARVSSYRLSAGAGNVLIQRMVDAEYSGVLFTRDPSAGGLAMIEMVQGTAENLVSGMVRPHSFRFGRVTKKPFGKDVRADRSWAAAGDGRHRGASVRRSAGHGMGLSRRPLPPRAKPRHHPPGRR